MQRQYALFLWHNITPRQFYEMGEGEQQILYAYAAMELKARAAEARQIQEINEKMR